MLPSSCCMGLNYATKKKTFPSQASGAGACLTLSLGFSNWNLSLQSESVQGLAGYCPQGPGASPQDTSDHGYISHSFVSECVRDRSSRRGLSLAAAVVITCCVGKAAASTVTKSTLCTLLFFFNNFNFWIWICCFGVICFAVHGSDH